MTTPTNHGGEVCRCGHKSSDHVSGLICWILGCNCRRYHTAPRRAAKRKPMRSMFKREPTKPKHMRTHTVSPQEVRALARKAGLVVLKYEDAKFVADWMVNVVTQETMQDIRTQLAEIEKGRG